MPHQQLKISKFLEFPIHSKKLHHQLNQLKVEYIDLGQLGELTITGASVKQFYGRNEDINDLRELSKRSHSKGCMTVITGRRRMGKTYLARKFLENENGPLYLYVSNKSETLIVHGFIAELKKACPNIDIIGKVETMFEFFRLLFLTAKKKPMTVVLDEFQRFYHINKSIYSELQGLWDKHKEDIKIHIIFIGSDYSMMHKIFEHSHKPLFGRADQFIRLGGWSFKTVKQILKDNNIPEDKIFDYFAVAGTTPKYIDYLLKVSAQDLGGLAKHIFRKNSLLINKGYNVLAEEFGKNSATYFSILELLGRGISSRSELESQLGNSLGAYLERLRDDYNNVTCHTPLTFKKKTNTRTQRWRIKDPFLLFWFRFIYPYEGLVEMEAFSQLREIFMQDYADFCGFTLERFFQKAIAETGQFMRIGSYWERKQDVEIDIIAANDREKILLICEVKRNREIIYLEGFKERTASIAATFKDYQIVYKGLSLNDVTSISK